MKRAFILLILPAFFLCFKDAAAQSLRSVVRQKMIDKVLEDDAKRDSVKAVEEGREPDKSPNTTMNHVYMDALGLSGNLEYKSSYQFDSHIEMEMSTYDEKGKLEDTKKYDTYVNKGTIDYGMVSGEKGEQTVMIYDDENSVMLMLTDSDGEKSGIAMGIDKAALQEEEAGTEKTATGIPANLKKTGRTKTILGYSCDEYMSDDEEYETRLWVSEKLGKEVRKNMLNNQQYFGGNFQHANDIEGMVLEYETLDKEEGGKMVMLVTGINLNTSHSISTREYAVLTMKAPAAEEEEEK